MWISDEPWGFAPFHYGRWSFVGTLGYCQIARIGRPYYSPALVAFADGGGFGLSFSVSAWFPLDRVIHPFHGIITTIYLAP